MRTGRWSVPPPFPVNPIRGLFVIPPAATENTAMLRVVGWIIGIIFLIGLLVVIGMFDLIF